MFFFQLLYYACSLPYQKHLAFHIIIFGCLCDKFPLIICFWVLQELFVAVFLKIQKLLCSCLRRSLGSFRKSVQERHQNSDGGQVKNQCFGLYS